MEDEWLRMEARWIKNRVTWYLKVEPRKRRWWPSYAWNVHLWKRYAWRAERLFEHVLTLTPYGHEQQFRTGENALG